MADRDPYARLERATGCLNRLQRSFLFKGCVIPLLGIVVLWIYIAINGPP